MVMRGLGGRLGNRGLRGRVIGVLWEYWGGEEMGRAVVGVGRVRGL
jgi:hypothetical protein